MSALHQHDSQLDSKLKIGFLLNTSFMLVEFVVGILTGSLALLADAGHNLTDSFAILISFIANHLANRPADRHRTFGYGRLKIVAAFMNALILVAVATYVFYEAIQRFHHPGPVNSWVIIIVAIIGIIMNGRIALLFRNNQQDLNIRSLYLNVALDALALIGTLVAGILVAITHQTVFDPLVAILIGLMLLINAWDVIWNALRVFLEGVPTWINYDEVEQAILAIPQIEGVDDLHIWAISSDYAALSCHIQVAAEHIEHSPLIVLEVEKRLKKSFKIAHTTIETETIKCPPGEACTHTQEPARV